MMGAFSLSNIRHSKLNISQSVHVDVKAVQFTNDNKETNKKQNRKY